MRDFHICYYPSALHIYTEDFHENVNPAHDPEMTQVFFAGNYTMCLKPMAWILSSVQIVCEKS